MFCKVGMTGNLPDSFCLYPIERVECTLSGSQILTRHLNLFSDREAYSLYDIYNNAFPLGGKLHVTLDRSLVYEKNIDIMLSETKMKANTKYGNRDKITDATLRLGIVVKSQKFVFPMIC